MTEPNEQVPVLTSQAVQLHPEWCRVTLASIGNAVMMTDTLGRISVRNPVRSY